MSSNSRIYANRIAKALDFLKELKISQYEIEERLNFTSLSKAKNFERYPQMIIERKTRIEVFNSILEKYNLSYNEESDLIYQKKSKSISVQEEEILYYAMYYYAFARETVGRALVRIINNKKVLIDYRLDEHWEGTYNVIENYTFIQAEKIGGVTPVKKLICLFSGTKKSGRPILIGTYSTIKRDGIPAAGKIVFEKVENQTILNDKIKREPDSRVYYYLMNKVMISETVTPNTLNQLNRTYKLIEKFSGEYYCFFSISNDVVKAELTIFNTSRVNLLIDKSIYSGTVSPIDNHTLKFELNDDMGFSDVSTNQITLLMNTSKSQQDSFYKCGGISNSLDAKNLTISCIVIEKDIYDKKHCEKTFNILDFLND